jgi:hypothetical protein
MLTEERVRLIDRVHDAIAPFDVADFRPSRWNWHPIAEAELPGWRSQAGRDTGGANTRDQQMPASRDSAF